MNFLQRIGNALSRFMYGRNGADQLGLTTIWAARLLDVATMFIKQQTVHLVISDGGCHALWGDPDGEEVMADAEAAAAAADVSAETTQAG